MQAITWFLIFCASLLAFSASAEASVGLHPKRYIINLDLPPKQRWTEVANDFKNSDIRFIHQLLDKFIPEFVQPILMKIVGEFDRIIPQPYADEIRGFAADIGMEIGDVLIPNIVYEIAETCISIVIQDSTGKVWLARNLDFVFQDFLRNATIEVDYQRNGKTVYLATTFAGYFGTMTGTKPGVFSVSMNARNNGTPWLSALVALLDRSAHLMSFLIRDTLDAATTFEDAVNSLAYSHTIAQAYIAVVGTKPGHGVIVSKNRLKPDDLWYLDNEHGRWYLVETNYDHWLPPPAGDDRQTPAMRALNATGQARITVDTMYAILSTPPVLQSSAIYATITSASEPSSYMTWIRNN